MDVKQLWVMILKQSSKISTPNKHAQKFAQQIMVKSWKFRFSKSHKLVHGLNRIWAPILQNMEIIELQEELGRVEMETTILFQSEDMSDSQ